MNDNAITVRFMKMIVPIAVSASAFLLFAAPAFAGVAGSVAPDYPSSVTVGDMSVPVSLTISNASTDTNSLENITVSDIIHAPACGTSHSNTCQPVDADPGVFAVHNGVGRAGTACAATVFTAGAPDANGNVTFAPSAAVVLGPSNPGGIAAQCIIDFTVDVLKAPTIDAIAAAGVQTKQLGNAHFVANTSDNDGNAGGSDTTTVVKIAPMIATTPSSGGPIGTLVHDSATVSGGVNPTGTVTFNLYGAGDTTCSAPAIFTSTNPVTAGSATSGNFTTLAAGTYHWTASYSGDASNAPAVSNCADETVDITKVTPSISTTPSAGGPIGTVLNDTAALSGGASPTGGVTFKLFAPSDASCTGVAVYTDTDTTAPYATSPGYTSLVSGTYHWTATYAGDSNNNSVSSGCQDEPVSTDKASPTITTTPSAGGPVGTILNDTATLSGGAGPTGAVTFNLYAPSDPACSAAPVYTSIDPSAPYASSPGFASNAVGVWHWSASYAGDANNNAATSSCASEPVTITSASTSVTTTLSATAVSPGTAVHDSATLSGATANAGGTATYTVYTDAACSLGAIDGGTKTVTNGVVPNSNSITFNTPGTYYWQVVYSGDVNNGGATSVCQSEIVTVGKFAPTISTVLSKTTASTTEPVHDSATLSGASADAGGTATYTVYTNASCSQGAMSAGTKTVVNGVVPDSDALTFATAGTYYWQVVYSGDAKNSSATSPCRSEILVVKAPASTGCEVDWKPVGAGWVDFAPIVYLNRGGRLLDPNNPCPLTLPLRFSPGRDKPGTSQVAAVTTQPEVIVQDAQATIETAPTQIRGQRSGR